MGRRMGLQFNYAKAEIPSAKRQFESAKFWKVVGVKSARMENQGAILTGQTCFVAQSVLYPDNVQYGMNHRRNFC